MSETNPNVCPGEAAILCYHHVADPPPGAPVRGLYCRPRQFAGQVAWMARRGARFATLRDLARAASLRDGAAVVLTFDDGYRDVFEEAFPVLEAHRAPAVVFPVVGDIGGEDVVWAESADQTPADLLTGAQLREMAAAGIEIGSHLLSHVHADRLAPEALEAEMRDSKARLEDLLGGPVVSLAYPFGAHDDAVVEAAGQAGYHWAVTTRPGSNRGAPALRLRRLSVKGTRWYHPWQFRRRLGPLLRTTR